MLIFKILLSRTGVDNDIVILKCIVFEVFRLSCCQGSGSNTFHVHVVTCNIKNVLQNYIKRLFRIVITRTDIEIFSGIRLSISIVRDQINMVIPSSFKVDFLT